MPKELSLSEEVEVLLEHAIKHRVALGLIVEGSIDPRTTVGTEAQKAYSLRAQCGGVRCWGNFNYRTEIEME